MKEFRSCESGQAVTEFALVLPMLLLLLLGIVELSRIGHAYLTVQEAARDAVRYVSVAATDAEVAQVVQQDGAALDKTKLTYKITPVLATNRRSGDPVTVEVRYPVQLITPVLGKVFPNPFVVVASVTMRKE